MFQTFEAFNRCAPCKSLQTKRKNRVRSHFSGLGVALPNRGSSPRTRGTLLGFRPTGVLEGATGLPVGSNYPSPDVRTPRQMARRSEPLGERVKRGRHPRRGYFLLNSIVILASSPALTVTSLVSFPKVSCQTWTLCVPGGTSVILKAPPSALTADLSSVTTTQADIHECASQTALITSGCANVSVIFFLKPGCALLITAFLLLWVWKLCRIPSLLKISRDPPVGMTTT